MPATATPNGPAHHLVLAGTAACPGATQTVELEEAVASGVASDAMVVAVAAAALVAFPAASDAAAPVEAEGATAARMAPDRAAETLQGTLKAKAPHQPSLRMHWWSP